MKSFPTDLCLIIDPAVRPDRTPERLLEDALLGGVRLIQYRDKTPPGSKAFASAQTLLELIRRYGGVLLINDHVDLALALGADGVHLGQEDLPVRKARSLMGPQSIIGASAHTVEQAVRAEEEGADYLGVGPVFSSPTKQVRPPIGLGILAEIKKSVRIPILAIGGIQATNVRSVLEAGADGIACISAIWNQPDVPAAAREMIRTVHAAGRR